MSEQLEQDTPASRAFAEAFDNPEDFDFGMEAEREASGLANFDFDPQEAADMRQKELERMADAQVPELCIGAELIVSGHSFKVKAIGKVHVILHNADREIFLTQDEVYKVMEKMQANAA